MIESTPALTPSTRTRQSVPRRRREPDGVATFRAVDATLRIDSVQDATILSELEPTQHADVRQRWEFGNRILNFALALLAIVILSPILVLVALAVRITSRGPVIYVQDRVGIDRRAMRTRAMYDRRASNVGGRVFAIYKFRSMRVDAEVQSGAVWATQNDPRVTPIGKFLRRMRLDELPQLINVLKGDMNIVGPRPERPTIFVNLRENIAEYPFRQRARPGITGLAQISHNYDASLDDVRTKVSYDLEYLARQSIWEDVKIMVKTLPVMLFKKGGW